MIPIRDTTPSKTVPVVNNTLIGVTILCYLIQIFHADDLMRLVYFYGLVPARYTSFEISSYFSIGHQLFSFISFMFLHGGFWHLLGNIWFLYIFGDNVEDHLGPYRYLGFYLLCGIASGLFHILFNFRSNVPVIGASGSIAGVMGAYFILHPRSRILTVIPVLFIPIFVNIPAFFFLGIWFLIQFFKATGSAAGYAGAGIAWWAHVGGFISGIGFLKLFSRVPETGVTRMTQQLAGRRKTPRLQVIRASGPVDGDINLYGALVITPYEALRGTRKLVNIPWGFHNRLFRVSVPPDTREGNILRLQGQGRIAPDGRRGDLMLTVKIETPPGG
ncbi:rhomboid family intramembrane serine protease [Desulfonema ishimotonii]|uniref:Rhomboid family intramembrane serine protease n=1 Tax=Desulfonema ishimotonii TaxID=45657 RepID=A0A401G2S2_9BACT|nr:rhomboid family intramembrane serine protease [Desulfonema ishimotonii]GBC63524.1 rhomboid family intramembrane serine protease [Desulfonema ishimotonii]